MNEIRTEACLKVLEEASDQGLKEWPVPRKKHAAARLLFPKEKLRNEVFMLWLCWQDHRTDDSLVKDPNNRRQVAFFSMTAEQ